MKASPPFFAYLPAQFIHGASVVERFDVAIPVFVAFVGPKHCGKDKK